MSRTHALTAVIATSSLLALGAVAPVDAKKKPSCKNKTEQAGCTLKNGASYTGLFAAGGSARVQVEKRSWYVGIVAAKGVCSPRFDRVSVDFKGRPKVGKTYKINLNRRKFTSGVIDAFKVGGTVKINSAKKATFTGSYFRQRTFRNSTFAPCARSLSTTAKRTD